MRHYNPNKAVQATKRGIIISYADEKKSTMVPYDRTLLTQQQLYGSKHNNKSYQEIQEPFNKAQRFLYRRALYGLAVYKPYQVQQMEQTEKFDIIKMHRRAQHVINVLKIDIINLWTKSFLSKLFWNSDMAKEFTDEKYDDYNEVCNMSFKDLGITEYMIADKLIANKILPDYFYQITAV